MGVPQIRQLSTEHWLQLPLMAKVNPGLQIWQKLACWQLMQLAIPQRRQRLPKVLTERPAEHVAQKELELQKVQESMGQNWEQVLLSTTNPNMHSLHVMVPLVVPQLMHPEMPQFWRQSPDVPELSEGPKVWLAGQPQVPLAWSVEPEGQAQAPLLTMKEAVQAEQELLPEQEAQLVTLQVKHELIS